MNVYDEMNKIACLYVILPSNYELGDVNKVYELNPKWVDKVVTTYHGAETNLSDVVHDFEGILSKDEFFVPRIDY